MITFAPADGLEANRRLDLRQKQRQEEFDQAHALPFKVRMMEGLHAGNRAIKRDQSLAGE
ncbi:hypothetical protein SB748_24850 [Rhizobium sp. SIMBA_035]